MIEFMDKQKMFIIRFKAVMHAVSSHGSKDANQ